MRPGVQGSDGHAFTLLSSHNHLLRHIWHRACMCVRGLSTLCCGPPLPYSGMSSCRARHERGERPTPQQRTPAVNVLRSAARS